MKPKTLMLLAVAAGCGLVAMLGVQQAMNGSSKPAVIETARVLVAIEPINPGIKFSETNVAFEERPLQGLPADVVRTPEEYAERSAKTFLAAGDIISKVKMSEPGVWGVSGLIPPGWRLKTISVDANQSHSGMLQAGDRVDVIITFQARDGKSGRTTQVKPLLECVEVLAVDDKVATKQTDGSEVGIANNVSLLVTPEQFAYITIAENKGKLSLAMRSRTDDEILQTKIVDEALLEELQGTSSINDERPLYAQMEEGTGPMEPEDKVPSSRQPRQPAPQDNPDKQQDNQSASEFLDEAEEDGEPVADASNQLAAVTPEKPKWTMQVYNGKNATEQQFELPEEPASAAQEGQIGGMLKALWNGRASQSSESTGTTE